jgi:hypothetical protein
MGSPITKWEGAAEYFTYADKPAVMYAILAAAVVVTVLAIIKGGRHEKEAYERLNGKK